MTPMHSLWIRRLAILSGFIFLSSFPATAQEARWKELDSQVGLLFQQGKYAEALPIALEAMRVAEATFGPEHLNVGLSLVHLGGVYRRLGRSAKAEPLLRLALAIFEKVRGAEHLDVAMALNNVAALCDDEGRYAEAEPLFRRTLAILEKALGPDHPRVAMSLSSLGKVYEKQGKYAEAEPLYRRALAIVEKALRPDHPQVADGLNDLATLYQDQGKYAEAEPLLRRALAIREKALGPEHLSVAESLNNVATLFVNQGKPAEAEQLFRRALAIREKALGPEHPAVAFSVNNLAVLYVNQGRYAEAEPLLKRALAIREKTLGPDHRDVATSLDDLALLYRRQGKYAEAELLYRRALAICEKTLGADHPFVATILVNLARVYRGPGKSAEAELLLKRALAIREKALGPEHPDVAASLDNLAELYREQGKYAEAEPLYRRALAIDDKVLSPDHPNLAGILNNLGALYREQAKYAEAEPLLTRALAIYERSLGPDHPFMSMGLNNLAILKFAQGKYAETAPLFDRSLGSLAKQFEYSFTYMSEKEKLEFLASLSYQFPLYFSFVFSFREQDPSLVGKMYDVLLWEKGFIAASAASLRAKILASGDPEALTLLDKLTAKKTQLASMVSSPSQGDPVQRRMRITQLEQETNDLEKELVKHSSSLAVEKTLAHVTWRDVQKTLPPGEAAVEIVRFPFCDGKTWTGAYYYVALVVTPEAAAPNFLVLGEAKKLEAAPLAGYRARVGRTRGVITAETEEAQGAAGEGSANSTAGYDAFWKPLEPALSGAKRVYVSSDGVLNQIPIGLFTDSSGQLLLEKYDLRLVNSTKDLLRPQHVDSSKTAVLVGNPKFDLSEPEQRAALEKLDVGPQDRPLLASASIKDTGLRSRDRPGGKLNPLPATQMEIDAVGKLLKDSGWQVAPYTGDRALEEVLDRARGPRILHVATHGFFLSDQQVAQRDKQMSDDRPAGLEDPMLRSGLYFAGADRAASGAPPAAGLEDGVLTAYEATQLNLQGTELVVLSACETGLGEQANGEGVFGLRRGLQEAGAESVLMSMWSVPDKETQELMALFYQKWLGGLDKHEALRQGQLQERATVRERYGKDLPFYWGAFVLVGR